MPRFTSILKTLAVVSLLAVFFWLDVAPSAEESRPPNVVFLISDDHGWTDYGFMGHPVVQTPHLDQLASEGMVWTRGYVPTSLCRPSLATLMTGLYPHQHGITSNDPDGPARDAANRQRMVDVFQQNRPLAGMLAEAKGYFSMQSGKWWEGQCQCGGFTFCMTHGDVERGGRHGDEGLEIGRKTMQPIYDFLDRAVGEQKPFFLWYAPFLPHTPHNPPERLLAKYRADDRPEATAKYLAMVEWLDETVGQLLGALEERALTENTLVLYVADNGWVQTEDPTAWYEGRAKMSPYDAGLRSPVILKWPGRVQAGRDERTLVSTIDFVPTVLAATGVEAGRELPGMDLRNRARLAGRKHLFGALFAHTAVDVENPEANLKYRWVLREDGWKLIAPYRPNAEVELMIRPSDVSWLSLEPELYNVLEDEAERQNLAGEKPDVVESLERQLDQWWPVSGS